MEIKIKDLLNSLDDELLGLLEKELVECTCEDCGTEDSNISSEESCGCSCETENNEVENIEASLSRVLHKKKTDEEILADLITEQEEYLAELYSKYNELTESEQYELSKEYIQEDTEVDSEILGTSLKMEYLLDEIKCNLESILFALDEYNNYILIDKDSVRDLEDIRTLTFLADDILKNLLETGE